jgi:hypothetical protein
VPCEPSKSAQHRPPQRPRAASHAGHQPADCDQKHPTPHPADRPPAKKTGRRGVLR